VCSHAGSHNWAEYNHRVAADAWQLYQIDKKRGLEYFKTHVKGAYAGAGHATREMQRWGCISTERDASMNCSARRGRKLKVTDEEILKCCNEFLDGYEVCDEHGNTQQMYFTSIERAYLSSKCNTITSILFDDRMTARELWRRMLTVMPELKRTKRTLKVRFYLPAKAKAARKRVAGQLRRISLRQLQSTIWIDAKRLPISLPRTVSLYMRPGAAHVIQDKRIKPGKLRAGQVLYYYACVNALEGVIYFTWVTGTTGLHTTRQVVYKTKVCPQTLVTTIACHSVEACVSLGWLAEYSTNALLHCKQALMVLCKWPCTSGISL
jgi:hypothetical protein